MSSPTREQLAEEIIGEGSALIQVAALYRTGTVTGAQSVEVIKEAVAKLSSVIPWLVSAKVDS